jgi:hypothetical protein
MRMMVRRLLLALRLDAAERAAQFLDLAFVGDLLALGDFNEFEDLVHLVVQFFQRIGDEQGVLDGLADRRGSGGTEIGGFYPLPLRGRNAGRRLWRAFGATIFAARFAALFTTRFATRFATRFWCGSRCGFGDRSFSDGFRFVRFGG